MMSSWRSGSVSSWITPPNLPNRPSARPAATPTATTAPPASRRRLALRRLTDIPAPLPARRARHARLVAARSCVQLLDQSGQLPLEVLDAAVVLDDMRSARGLFRLGELACLPLVDKRVTARLRPLAAHVVGGDHGERRVEGAVDAGLEQQ